MLSNEIAVEAHVAKVPIVQIDDPVWDWSADRAFQLSELLISYGLDPDRVRRLTAYGDREPKVENLLSERNNRIELIFLRY